MDAWQTSVETRLSEIKTELRDLRSDITKDFRWLLGVFGSAFLILLTGMASGFLWIADKLP